MKYLPRMSCLVFVLAGFATAGAQPRLTKKADSPTAARVLTQIIRAEDQRRWNDELSKLLTHDDPKIRRRAVLAAGRIGNEGAVPLLAERVLTDRDVEVRQMAAFALGEIESGGGAYALTEVLKTEGVQTAPAEVRGRAVEALGKIVAAATGPAAAAKPDAEWLDIVQAAIVNTLRFEDSRRAQSDRLTILLALTAVLRAKPDGVGKLVAQFLDYPDSRIVADALNTLARLRLKEGTDKARELLKHNDPIVRANAARVLGATEDKQAFDALLDRALHDADSRVGISAIRSLASLKDARAVQPLVERGEYLLKLSKVSRQFSIEPRNELLEITTTLGRLLPNTDNQSAIEFIKRFRILDQLQSPETEIAFARISPETYLASEPFVGTKEKIAVSFPNLERTWRASNSLAQGLAELANLPPEQKKVRSMALMNFALMIEQPGSHRSTIVPAIPAYLRAYAAFKNELDRPELKSPSNPNEDVLSRTLRAYVVYRSNTAGGIGNIGWREDYRSFGYQDVIVRATAAELLAEQAPSKENTEALVIALGQALKFDTRDNDAALAILAALAKQKNKEANDAIKTALDSKDHLLRRRAASLLKANAVGDFSDRIGTVETRNTDADYRRAIARIGKKPTATVVTNKGSFTIEFLAEDAPLTVDNFLQLAKRGYFNGQTVPRVVANFVVQAGDPRGDQNGGPGYTIRCEVNEVPYERAAVGMALSGKDTGGSQWFVTHSPQPHLDGGYTVFGRVIRGMEVVDRIARGDRIVRVIVSER
jgi:cyclophilin family peptidyl-prolyl cis-trans isomerase/HEAT repeat protein